MSIKDEVLNELLRGTVAVTTLDELKNKLNSRKKLRVKLGVDPTTKDLHVGHTVCLRKMRAFQDQGHTGVLIIGDFTARVGDPSGQNATRPVLTKKEILENARTYKEQAFSILDKKKTEVVFNSKWLEPFMKEGKVLDSLSKVTHSRLIERDDFQNRISEGRPISMLEILYPVFQGFDSVAVKADIELGGTDQTFNLIFGRDMQRDSGQDPQVVMTMPILTGTDGVRKMSKTYDNFVALEDKPNDMFGKIMSIDDRAMMLWAELLTNFDMGPFRSMHPMEAKMMLAQAMVNDFHGDDISQKAKEWFMRVHSQKKLPEHIPDFALPNDKKLFVSQVLCASGLAQSRKDAQRKINEGAVKLEGKVIKDDRLLEIEHPSILTLGTRRFCRVVP
ncbi:tyrosine--tRNA ligase [Elusimicrobiota bacterium]